MRLQLLVGTLPWVSPSGWSRPVGRAHQACPCLNCPIRRHGIVATASDDWGWLWHYKSTNTYLSWVGRLPVSWCVGEATCTTSGEWVTQPMNWLRRPCTALSRPRRRLPGWVRGYWSMTGPRWTRFPREGTRLLLPTTRRWTLERVHGVVAWFEKSIKATRVPDPVIA